MSDESRLIEIEDIPADVLDAVERLLVEIEAHGHASAPEGAEDLRKRVETTAVVVMSLYRDDLWVSITDEHPGPEPEPARPTKLFASGYDMGWKVLAEWIRDHHPDLCDEPNNWLDEGEESMRRDGPPKEWLA